MDIRKSVYFLAVLFITSLTFAFTGGDGTAGNPYQISTRADLEAVNSNLAASYILMNDIDLTGKTYAQAVIAPDISTSSDFQGTMFTATFNGNGFNIKNLTISASGKDYIGLFGCTDTNAVITNICFTGGSVNGNNFVGALVGHSGSRITNCYSMGIVIGNNYVGGLVGHNLFGSITNCYSMGSANGTDSVGALVGDNYGGFITNCYSTGGANGRNCVGGLVGISGSRITNCYSIGNVNGTGSSVGGLVGHSGSLITNCYSTGSVNGASTNIGGLVGINYAGTIKYCYSTGSVRGVGTLGGSFTGGLVGKNEFGSNTNCYSTGSVSGRNSVGGLVGNNYSCNITNCYSTGNVNGNDRIGGLVGNNFAGSNTNCFWDTETSGRTTSDGGIGRTTVQMKTQSTFTGWDFVNETATGRMDVWCMPQDGYPMLWWQAGKGDINYDGVVDEGDLAVMVWQWLALPQDGERLVGDVNIDGAVDLADYAILAGQWGSSD